MLWVAPGEHFNILWGNYPTHKVFKNIGFRNGVFFLGFISPPAPCERYRVFQNLCENVDAYLFSNWGAWHLLIRKFQIFSHTGIFVSFDALLLKILLDCTFLYNCTKNVSLFCSTISISQLFLLLNSTISKSKHWSFF